MKRLTMHATTTRARLASDDEPTRPIDLLVLEQQRARARRTAVQPAIAPLPLLPPDDDDDRIPTRPRAAVGTMPPPLPRSPTYPIGPARDPGPIVIVMIALAGVAAGVVVLFYG